MRSLTKASILAAAAALIATAAIAGDNIAGYQKRDDTMKQLGRNFYIGIGRVVSGRNPYGPDTVTAAENLTRLVADLPTLFPSGSDVQQSKMNPAILTAADRGELIAHAQQAAAALVPAVKDGATNKQAMADAYKAAADACNACHKKYRNE
jgi:cytochrome c556